jgi:phosphatidate cytidylyltransferase
MSSNLFQRVAVAVVAIPAALVVVYLGGIPLTLLIAVISLLGAREVYDLARRQGIEPARGLGLVTAFSFAPLYMASLGSFVVRDAMNAWWPYAAALWLVLLHTVVLALRSPTERPLSAASITVFGALYAGALPAFLLVIRHASYGQVSWPGTWLVFFPLVVTWVGDTAAMFGGQAIGGPKLWPAVSPGKTWAGSICGVLGGVATVPLLNVAVLDRLGVALPLGRGLLFAAALSVVGQVGDLGESLFKREVGVKDSSSLIPGHGGILDRLDSLYFVLPTAAALYRLFGVI